MTAFETFTPSGAKITSGLGGVLNIGTNNTGSPYYRGINAAFDDVRVYNRVLSAQEISDVYAYRALTPGSIIFNQDNAAMQYCDGTDWRMMGIGSYNPNAVTFDGTNDWLVKTSDLTGNVDSDLVTGSFWVKGPTGGNRVIYSAQNSLAITIGGDQQLHMGFRDLTNTISPMLIDYSGNVTMDDDVWHHVLFSFDASNQSGSHVYVDDVQDDTFASFNEGGGPINLTYTNHGIGTYPSGAPSSLFIGEIADFWFDGGTYMDLTVEANRRKFISASGMPMYLGPDGSIPTGTAPDIFLSSSTAGWHVNNGTGGGFTESGELTYSSSRPGDSIIASGGLTNGLLGYWKLDELTYTSAADSSGNGYDGSFLNGLNPATDSVSGVIGTALTFDGTNDTVMVNSNAAFDIAISGSFSQFIWFKKTTDCGANAGGNNEVMMNRWGSAYTNRTWWFGCDVTTDELEINFYGSGGSVSVTGPVVDDGIWHHGGWFYDGTAGVVRLYLDGIQVNSQSYTLDAAMNVANPICIGGYDDLCSDSRFFFDGELDDARIYNRALSNAEINQLYKYGIPGKLEYNADFNVMEYFNGADWVAMGPIGGTPPTSGLVGNWKLDETTGTTATDSSGNGNNGTWVNSPVPTTPAVIDGGLHFDKTGNNYISVTNPSSAFTTAPFTIAGWVYFDALATTLADSQIFFRMRHSVSPWNGYQAQLDSAADDLIFVVRNAGGTGYTLTSDNPLEAGKWYHVALTLNSSYYAILYINGVAQADTETPGSLYAADSDLRFGGNNGSGQNLEGAMDDLRFYSRALSPQEIEQLYHYGLSAGLGDVDNGCTNPARPEGTMLYNADNSLMQYCNGEEWIKIGH